MNFKELWGLGIMCIKRPLYILPTIKATYRCVAICDKEYGKGHHSHNVSNGVRHALWNVLIAKYCLRKNDDTDRVLAWTHLITDWHEDFSVNAPLERAMDLHNNEMGRDWFCGIFSNNEEEIVRFIQKKSTNAQKVSKIEEIDLITNKLVYLED